MSLSVGLIQCLYSTGIYSWVRGMGLSARGRSRHRSGRFRYARQKLPEFEHQGGSIAFGGWLWTITRNKCREWARRQGLVPGTLARQSSTGGRRTVLGGRVPPPTDSSNRVGDQSRLPRLGVAFCGVTSPSGKPASRAAAELGITSGPCQRQGPNHYPPCRGVRRPCRRSIN